MNCRMFDATLGSMAFVHLSSCSPSTKDLLCSPSVTDHLPVSKSVCSRVHSQLEAVDKLLLNNQNLGPIPIEEDYMTKQDWLAQKYPKNEERMQRYSTIS